MIYEYCMRYHCCNCKLNAICDNDIIPDKPKPIKFKKIKDKTLICIKEDKDENQKSDGV